MFFAPGPEFRGAPGAAQSGFNDSTRIAIDRDGGR
jgi:hypothetical protein